MDKQTWMRFCNASISRTPLELQQANYSSGGVAVLLFTFAAVTSAVCYGLQRRLLLWRRRGWEVVGDRIWKHLGSYSGWMCAGCSAGAVTFAAIVGRYERLLPSSTDRLRFEREALSRRYSAVCSIFYPLHVLCVVFAMNLLLRRVSDHASHSYYNEARDHDSAGGRRFDWRDCVGQYKLYYLVRSMHVLVVLICALNVPAWIVLAVFYADKAALFDEAAAACDAGGSDVRSESARALWAARDRQSDTNLDLAFVAAGTFEVFIRVLMAASFLLFFPACIVMFRRVERRLDGIVQEMNLRSDVGTVFLPYEFSPAAADGTRAQVEMEVVEARAFLGNIKSAAAAQRTQFRLCLLLVLLALLLQSLLAVFVAAYSLGLFKNPDCGDCEGCQVLQQLQYTWTLYTPELVSLGPSVCSTLPLVFSLWLMTTRDDRALLLNPGRFRADAVSEQPPRDASAMLKTERVRMGVELL